MHYIITPFLEFNELCIGINLGLSADVNIHNNTSEKSSQLHVWSAVLQHHWG